MKDKSKRVIVLVDPSSSKDGSVQQWLNTKGYVAWKAKDLCHVLEELSDFTVQMSPDVVLLEVASLPECFDSLQTALRQTTNDRFSVVGLAAKRPVRNSGRYFAMDLDQLGTIINRESAAAA